jgi:VWFA-related protein
MFRAIVRLVLVIGVGVGGGVLLFGQQRPVFRSDVNFVTVDAYPLIDGRVVEGLTLADFEVREDGRPQHVESFEYVRADARLTEAERRDPDNQREMLDQLVDPRARVFVAFLDANNVGISGAFYSRLPLLELFDRILAPSDLIALTTSRNPPGELTFGRKGTVVRQQLSDFWTWQDPDVTVNDAEESMVKMCFPMDEGVGQALVARRRQDQLLSTLEGLVDYLGEVREGRKTVFLFSAGWTWFEPDEALLKVLNRPSYVPPIGVPITNEPWRNLRAVTSLAEGSKATCETELRRLAALNSPPRFRELLRRASQNNVVFYPVNPSGVGAIGGRNDRLMELASNTGGTAVSNRNDLVQGIVDVSREFAGYYLLGYASDNRAFDGTLRRIEVKVRRPGVEVKARRGYRALTEKEAASRAAASSNTPLVSDERAAVDDAMTVLARLRGTEDVFIRGVQRDDGLDVVIELAPTRIGQAWTADVQVTPMGGGEPRVARVQIAAGARAGVAPITVPSPSGGGAADWRISARLRNADGAVLEGLGELRARAGVIRPPRVSRAGSSAASPVSPAADLRFMRSERLVVEWPATVGLTAPQVRVLDRTGAALPFPVQVAPRVDGDAVRAAVALAAFAPGDFVIELTATVADAPARHLVAFRVVR